MSANIKSIKDKIIYYLSKYKKYGTNYLKVKEINEDILSMLIDFANQNYYNGLTFDNESDYNKIKEDDTFNFIDLVDFSAGKQLTLEVIHTDGTKENIKLNHTYNEQQIEWFKAGSALNLIKMQES